MKNLCILCLVLIATAAPGRAQQSQKHFDKFSYGTIAAASALAAADCEVSASRVASGYTKELNKFFVRADGSFKKATCYGINAAWIGGSIFGQRFSDPKYKRWFDGVRVGAIGAKIVVVTVRF